MWKFLIIIPGILLLCPPMAQAAAPSEFHPNYRDLRLCLTAQTNCPTSVTLSGTLVNTDGTTTASTPQWYSKTTSVATVVQATGVVTQASIGLSQVRGTAGNISCSGSVDAGNANQVSATCHNFDADDIGNAICLNSSCGDIININGTEAVTTPSLGSVGTTGTVKTGPSATVYVSVRNANTYPHFNSDHTIGTAWSSLSLNLRSTFFTITDYNSALWNKNYAAAGLNTIESDYTGGNSPITASQSSWTNTVQTNATNVCGGDSFYRIGIGDNLMKDDAGLFSAFRNPGGSWSTLPLQIVTQAWATAGCMYATRLGDEYPWGQPFKSINDVTIGSGITSLTYSGTSGTVAQPGFKTWNSNTAGGGIFLITGTGTSLDFNSATNSPQFHLATQTPGVGYTFTGPSLTPGTVTAGIVEPYAVATWNGTSPCPPKGGASTPCTDYLRYDTFIQTHNARNAVSSRPAFGFPPIGNAGALGAGSWCDSYVADYCPVYVNTAQITYLPSSDPLSDLTETANQIGQQVRLNASFNPDTPFASETFGTSITFNFVGRKFTAASCSGDIITTTTNHQTSNVVPGLTRLDITGANGCAGRYFVTSSPTATTFRVVLANATVTGTGNNGTLTFDNGQTITINNGGLAPGITMTTGNSNSFVLDNSVSTCPGSPPIRNLRGHKFTISGNSNAAFNGLTGFFALEAGNTCAATINPWWQVPNLSGTSGDTVAIIDDNNYQRGGKSSGAENSNSENGPKFIYASQVYPDIVGAAVKNIYQYTQDPQGCDMTGSGLCWSSWAFSHVMGFPSGGGNTNLQAGPNGKIDIGRSLLAWQAIGVPNLMSERLKKFNYGQTLACVNPGPQFECAARTNANGNYLQIQSFVDGPRTFTVDLTSCVVGGQKTIRYIRDWTGILVTAINAGVISDSPTIPPAGTVDYICSNNASVEYAPPTFSASLSAVANATKILLAYSYTPYPFAQQSDVLPNIFDCGTGSCTPPWDLNIGHVQYQLIYLDTNGVVLSTSDVQTW